MNSKYHLPGFSTVGRRIVSRCCVAAAVCVLCVMAPGAPAARAQRADDTIGIVENRGQVVDTRGMRRPDILYTASSHGMRLFLRRDGISYVFMRWIPDTAGTRSDDLHPHSSPALPTGTLEQVRVDMNLAGTNSAVEIVGANRTESYTNYYLPQCPEGITQVPSFGKVIYRNIYHDIDLVVYSAHGLLKYDFVVRPGGRASDIRWSYAGATSASIGTGGALDINSVLGNIEEAAPYAYQQTPQGIARQVACGYAFDGAAYGYRSASYNAAADLVIDPTVQWATYVGGSETEMWNATRGGITADPSGPCAIGSTLSINFPITPGALQSTRNGASDMFVTKLSASGALIWGTYLGGSGDELGRAIVRDNAGNYAIAGASTSNDFPVSATAQQIINAGGNDIVAGKLNSGGLRVWATYLGGAQSDIPEFGAIDAQDNFVVAGETESDNLAFSAALQSVYGGQTDGFITKFSANGSLLWATYYGGQGFDAAYGVAIDPGGDIMVTGNTSSTDLPMSGSPYHPTLHGTILGDAFLIRLNSGGAPKWSTYYGGGFGSFGYGVVIDSAHGVVMVGGSFSSDLPTTGSSLQASPASSAEECFVAKFDATGKHRWSTYYGGSGAEVASAVAIGPFGDILVAGSTGSLNCPMPAGTYQQALRGPNDAFVLQMDSGGTQRRWATYYGGSSTDDGHSLAFTAGSAYLMGATASNDLTSTTTGFQPVAGGNGDAFIVKFTGFCLGTSPTIVASGPTALCDGDSVTLTASSGFSSYQWSPNNETGQSIVVKRPGTYTVTGFDPGGCATSSNEIKVVVSTKPVPVITPAGPITICDGDSVQLFAKDTAFATYKWSNGATADRIWVKDSGAYSVTVTGKNGCTGTSAPVSVRVQPRTLAPVFAIGDTLRICSDSALVLDAGSYGSYHWFPNGETIRAIRPMTSGLYYVDVTDPNSCTVRSDSVAVIVYGRVPVNLIVSGGSDLCFGDSTTLRISVRGATLWSTGRSGDSLIVRASGLYYATVTDSNGCRERTDSIAITVHPEVKADIAGPIMVCTGANATYSTTSAGTLSYTWTISGDGAIQGAADGRSVAVLWGASGGGTLTLRVTDTVTKCSATHTLGVTIGTSLKPVTVPSGDISLCAGDSVVLDAGSGYASYLWSTGATSQRIVVRQTGAYAVTVRDASGCGGTSDSVRVNVNSLPVLAITPAGPIILNPGDSVELDAGTGHMAYQWTDNGSDAGTSRTLVARDSGSYMVRVTDSSGCMASAVVRVDLLNEHKGTAEIALADAQAKPGDLVTIPLRLVTSTNLADAGASSYEARIRYRASMLVPADATPRGTITGTDRVLTLTGNLPPGMTSGELGRMNFIAAMGDTESIAITLENVTWRGTDGSERDVASVLHGSQFNLTGLCTIQGTRLVATGESAGLKAVIPNPSSGTIRIEYELLEDGFSRVWLSDLLGREVAVIATGINTHGHYSTAYDAAYLPAGLYMIVLETPTGREGMVVQLEK